MLSGHSHIRINRVAVSDVEGKATLFADAEGSSIASLFRRRISKEIVLRAAEDVETIRLETYIEKNGLGHIAFLKFDIEGNELKAIRGLGRYLRADFIDAMQFEYGGANLDSLTTLREMFDILGDARFRLFKIMPRSLEPREYVPSMDNFMYSNYIALSPNVRI